MCCWCAKNAATQKRQWNAKEWRFMECGTRYRYRQRYEIRPNTCGLHTWKKKIEKKNELRKLLWRATKAIRIMVETWMGVRCHISSQQIQCKNQKWNGFLAEYIYIYIYSSMRSLRATRLNIWIFWWDMNFLLVFPKSFVASGKTKRNEKKMRTFFAMRHTISSKMDIKYTMDLLRHSKYLKFKFNIPLCGMDGRWSLKIIVLKPSAKCCFPHFVLYHH